MSNMQHDTGTVAVVECNGQQRRAILNNCDGALTWFFDEPVGARMGAGPAYIASVRPLVVLDLDEYDWLPNRLRIHGAEMGGVTGEKLRRLADQIEQQTNPPRIAEPGLWGVVEATAVGIPRRRWVHHEEDRWVSDEGTVAHWDGLRGAVLVREGVTS